MLPREQLNQISLYFLRRFLACEPKQGRQPFYVGIDNDALVDTKRVSKNDIGSLATYTRKSIELDHGPWHFSIMQLNDTTCESDNILSLVPEESRRANNLLDVLSASIREIRRSRIPPEEFGSNHVDALIRRLR